MQKLGKNREMKMALVSLIVAIVGGVPGLIGVVDHFQNRAQFIVGVQNVITGASPTGGDSMVFLTVTITNSGNKPLTPASFDLEIWLRDKWVAFDRSLIPKNLELRSNRQTIDVTEAYEKDLQRLSSPITFGMPVDGFMMFWSKEVSLDQLRQFVPLRFKITCTDVFGKHHTRVIQTEKGAIDQGKVYPKHGLTVTPK